MPEIAHRHLEQILNAAIRASLPPSGSGGDPRQGPSDAGVGELVQRLAGLSMGHYRSFIGDSRFWPWFVGASPIAFIGSLPIASRPVARGSADGRFAFDQLRAIPWVFSWIQMRALAPGWFGMGAALASCSAQELDMLAREVRRDQFLSTVFDNASQEIARARMAIVKRYAALGAGGEAMFDAIHSEFNRARAALLIVTDRRTLLDQSPVIAASIAIRNPWTDVLNLIQIELLRRANAASSTQRAELEPAILASINGIAAAMQSTG
jgi:phosphoenolpyruvate carboxylase